MYCKLFKLQDAFLTEIFVMVGNDTAKVPYKIIDGQSYPMNYNDYLYADEIEIKAEEVILSRGTDLPRAYARKLSAEDWQEVLLARKTLREVNAGGQ